MIDSNSEMKKTADQGTNSSLQKDEEASDSAPTLDPSPSAVITFLRAWKLKALSVLAMLADNGGGISGSGSLGIFCNNSTSTDSDLDMYLPAVQEAAQDAIHVLRTSGVRWKNFLSDRIEDVRKYDTTIAPYWAISETVDMLKEQNYTMSEFSNYLRTSLLGESPERPELVENFIDYFCGVCQHIEDKRKAIEDSDEIVWVFRAQGSRFSSVLCLVPLAISEKIHHILEALEFRSDDSQGFNGRSENEIRDKPTPKLGGPDSAELKACWEKEGYHQELLQKYMNARVLKERRQHSRAQVFALVNESLNPEKIGSPSVGKTNNMYDSRFRILHGTLPDGRNLQLIFVPTTEGGIIHTILKFYASHVMSFVSGTMAAHLYYSTAKYCQGITWDFKQDPRQAGAEKAIQKYEERKWEFQEGDREIIKTRHAGDEHVKFISLEDCYTSALRERYTTTTLPDWWQAYFKEREVSFRGYGWWEEYGKITKVQKKWSQSASYKLLGWVHDSLAGHKDVISRTEWEFRDDKRSMLDLWFGGVRVALPNMRHAERYNRFL